MNQLKSEEPSSLKLLPIKFVRRPELDETVRVKIAGLIGEFCGGRKLFDFLPLQTPLKWKVKKVLFSPSIKITEDPKKFGKLRAKQKVYRSETKYTFKSMMSGCKIWRF
ncbi:MAG: hypothetical protein AAF806_04840 [Bacteroidota bacterium]